jgi:hypothetical protein
VFERPLREELDQLLRDLAVALLSLTSTMCARPLSMWLRPLMCKDASGVMLEQKK